MGGLDTAGAFWRVLGFLKKLGAHHEMNASTHTKAGFALTNPGLYQALNNLDLFLLCSQKPDAC